MSLQEKRQYFLYLLILFIVAGILLIWIVFRNNRSSPTPGITIHPQDNQWFLNIQQQHVIPLFDTVVTNIDKLQQFSNDYSIKYRTSIDIQKISSYGSDTPRDGTGVNYKAFLLMEKYLSLYRGEAINNIYKNNYMKENG